MKPETHALSVRGSCLTSQLYVDANPTSSKGMLHDAESVPPGRTRRIEGRASVSERAAHQSAEGGSQQAV